MSDSFGGTAIFECLGRLEINNQFEPDGLRQIGRLFAFEDSTRIVSGKLHYVQKIVAAKPLVAAELAGRNFSIA